MAALAIGLVMAFGALLGAATLEGISFGSLIAPSPLMLVFMGATGATMIGYSMDEIKRIPKALIKAFTGKPEDPNDLVTQFAKFADMARREGTLALEGEIKKVEDPFLRTGLQLVVDGVDGDQVKEVMMTEIHALKDRHHAGISFFNTVGGFAPTFGLMGTIIGLVGVLAELSDPEKLGHGMALGLLGTLWGVMGANLIFLPIGAKLTRLHENEISVKLLTVEGVLAIREGVATRLLVERLEARLAPEMRVGHSQRAKEAA